MMMYKQSLRTYMVQGWIREVNQISGRASSGEQLGGPIHDVLFFVK